MSVLILGDPHIGKSNIGKSGIGSNLNSRIVDQLNILEWVLKQAIDYTVSSIIITGDVFEDPKPHPTFISLFISWIKKCTDNDIDVHIIVGNHDILRSGQFYTSPLDIISAADVENVFVHKSIGTLHTNGASFTLMPFRDRRSFNVNSNTEAVQLLASKIPYELSEIDYNQAKVVIGHFAIEGSIPVGDEIHDSNNELYCPVSMFKGYDYVWMGHIHKPQIMSKDPFISHIGSMDLSDFSESNHNKHIVIFDTESNTPYKYLEIPTRPLKQISISVPSQIQDTNGFILNEIRKNIDLNKSIVKVNIELENTDSVSVDRSMIDKCLMELGVFHVFRVNEERKISPIKTNASVSNIDNTVNEFTAIKMFADTNVDENIKDDFIALATSVVQEYAVSKDK